MGFFSDTECRHCGSTDHATSDCPHDHGLFGLGADTECGHCGSKEHATRDCPHDQGIFGLGADTECRHCGSKDHATDDCPHHHGIFGLGEDTECGHCGSKNHATDDCPHNHGIFGLGADTECRHCGSSNHATDECPHRSFSGRKSEDEDSDGSDSSNSTDGETYASDDDDETHWDTSVSVSPDGASASSNPPARMAQTSSATVGKNHAGDGCLVFLVLAALVGGFLFLRPDIRKDTVKTFQPTLPQTTKSTPAVSSWTQPGETEAKILERAHSEIDYVYKTVMANLNPAQQESLRQEELEWIKWRDAEADKIARTTSKGGSAYRVDRLSAMTDLVKKRTEYLRRYRPKPAVRTEELGYIEPPSGTPIRKAILDTIRTPAESYFGQPVVFQVNRLRVSGLWAWFTGVAVKPDGSKVDYRKSKDYKRDRESVQIGLEAGELYGGVDALLKIDDTGWKIMTLTFDAGDVYWLDFPQRFGCPEVLFSQ